MRPRAAIAALAAAATLVALALALAGPGTGERVAVRTLVADARFPAAMVATPGGGLLYGERLTGRVVRVDPSGATDVIGEVAVSTEGEQRGLLGIAVRGDEVFVSFTSPSGRLQIKRLGGRLVWAGPQSADRANGGRIAFSPDGSLVVGVGDLLDPEAAVDPATPNGKILAIDPDGAPDQRPETISSGWNNPFAFAFAPDGTLYVADNVGGVGDERLAIGNGGPAPIVLATLAAHSVPSGVAVLPDGRLGLCTYLARTLRIYRVGPRSATPDVVPLATDCSIGVVTLADGSLAYASEDTIRVIDP